MRRWMKREPSLSWKIYLTLDVGFSMLKARFFILILLAIIIVTLWIWNPAIPEQRISTDITGWDVDDFAVGVVDSSGNMWLFERRNPITGKRTLSILLYNRHK
jgi:hypothetical protein